VLLRRVDGNCILAIGRILGIPKRTCRRPPGTLSTDERRTRRTIEERSLTREVKAFPQLSSKTTFISSLFRLELDLFVDRSRTQTKGLAGIRRSNSLSNSEAKRRSKIDFSSLSVSNSSAS
jgi:hypothetical protein